MVVDQAEKPSQIDSENAAIARCAFASPSLRGRRNHSHSLVLVLPSMATTSTHKYNDIQHHFIQQVAASSNIRWYLLRANNMAVTV
jgi:hypothetical protein